MLIIFRLYETQIINIMSVLRTFWPIFDSHGGNVNNFPGLMTPKLLTLPVFYALFEKLFDSHRENVNNSGPHDPQIINITSVLRTFWEIIDSHRGNVNNFGPHELQMLNSTSVLRMFKQFLIPLNWTYPPALGFLLPAQTLILCLESKPTCHKMAVIEFWKEKR